MSVSRCPNCQLPYLPAEIVADACPTCGFLLHSTSEADDEGDEARRLPWTGKRWLVVGAVLLLALAGAGWVYVNSLLSGDGGSDALALGPAPAQGKPVGAKGQKSSEDLSHGQETEQQEVRNGADQNGGKGTDHEEADATGKDSTQANAQTKDGQTSAFKAGLRELNLSHSHVTPQELRQLKGLSELRVLKLKGTTISGAGLEDLKGLMTLDLSDTPTTDETLSHLNGLTELRTLDLSRTKVIGPGLSALTGLNRLDLTGTPFNDEGLKHLAPLKELRVLILRDTGITGAGLEQLKNLKTLDLSGSAITDKGLHHLEGLTGLRLLYLHQTRVSDQAVQALTKTLPGLKAFR